MRKYLCLVLFLCTSFITQAYQLNTVFDSLFPMTWYQKGLEASLSAWQILINSFENNDSSDVPFDTLLGMLARVQFCVDRMKQQDIVYAGDDKDYFIMVLNTIKNLVGAIVVDAESEDFVVCAQEMLSHIQQQIRVP